MRNQAVREESSLGLMLGISAIVLMGYVAGSPDVAPMLPVSVEQPFTKLHRELHEIGSGVVQSAWDTLQRAASVFTC